MQPDPSALSVVSPACLAQGRGIRDANKNDSSPAHRYTSCKVEGTLPPQLMSFDSFKHPRKRDLERGCLLCLPFLDFRKKTTLRRKTSTSPRGMLNPAIARTEESPALQDLAFVCSCVLPTRVGFNQKAISQLRPSWLRHLISRAAFMLARGSFLTVGTPIVDCA